MYDVIIVGAGASGVFLALTLKYKNPNLKVALIEKNDKLGKKLLITGNGRCNLGNTNITVDNYNSSSSLNNFISQLKENGYLKSKVSNPSNGGECEAYLIIDKNDSNDMFKAYVNCPGLDAKGTRPSERCE